MVSHVRQEEPFGCVVACIAMVTGESYAQVRADMGLGDVARGFTHYSWQDMLARRGFASQLLFMHDGFLKRDRRPWPLQPWAELHLCSVDAGRGIGSHLVVMLADGVVLDPATEVARRLSDYASVAYMAGLFRVDRQPYLEPR